MQPLEAARAAAEHLHKEHRHLRRICRSADAEELAAQHWSLLNDRCQACGFSLPA